MNIYWRIQKPGYVINYDVVRSKKWYVYYYRAVKTLFSREKNPKIFTFDEISSGGVKIFTFDEFRHFRRVTNFSVPVYTVPSST